MKPLLFDAKRAHRKKIITYDRSGNAFLRHKSSKILIPKSRQYDLTRATIFGLNERLTMAATSPKLDRGGRTLRDDFNLEWVKYEKWGEDYGVYAYYESRNDLVKFAPAEWHRIVAVASSSMLLVDPDFKFSWKKVREILSKKVVGVAGGSVGNNVLHGLVMDLRPDQIKIADKSLYKMENINRVRLSYWDIASGAALRNKAEVSADQVYAIDPFINIYEYPEGLSLANIGKFFGGHAREPKIDILCDEVDDPRIKILLRKEARRRRIPLIMVTDAGSSTQLDVLRYDLDRKAGLSYGVSDAVLEKSMEAVYDNPGNRAIFYEFVDALIGKDYRMGELQKIIEGKTEIPTSTIIPQLGSTAALAGAIAAEAVARILLGHSYPSRVIINKYTFEIKKYNGK